MSYSFGFMNNTSSSDANKIGRMYSPGNFQHSHKIDVDPTLEAKSDDECTRKLEDFFEHQAGLTMVGRRDTIDSILSKYDTIRAEVQQNPRICLALSAEFDPLSLPGPSLFLLDVPVDSVSVQEADELSSDRDTQNTSEERQPEDRALHNPRLDYAEHLRQQIAIASDKDRSINNFSSASEDSDDYDKDNTDATWNGQENALLKVYAELDDDFFQSEIETSPVGDSVRAIDAQSTEREWLSTTTSLSMSPIVQVVMVQSILTFNDETATATPRPPSDDVYGVDNVNNKDVVSASAKTPSPSLGLDASVSNSIEGLSSTDTANKINDSTASKHLHNFVDTQQRTNAFIAQHTASFPYRIPNDVDLSVRNGSSDWSPIKSDRVVADIEPIVPVDVWQWLEQIEPESVNTATTPSFLAWLEEDDATEYVLGFGLNLVLSTVVLAGRVLW